MLYENAILVENESHKNRYPAPKDFIALIEGQVGVINFIKDPAISGPAAKTAFTVIKVASYVCFFPLLKEKGIQLIKNYLCQVPVAASPLIIQSVIDRVNELRLLHLANQDWARTFFSLILNGK